MCALDMLMHTVEHKAVDKLAKAPGGVTREQVIAQQEKLRRFGIKK